MITNNYNNDYKIYFSFKKLGLSHREAEVAIMLLEGKTEREIANNLNIEPSTVHSHKKKIYGKTGTKNKVELVLFALKKGILIS